MGPIRELRAPVSDVISNRTCQRLNTSMCSSKSNDMLERRVVRKSELPQLKIPVGIPAIVVTIQEIVAT